jgi:hypothetical protein
MVSLPIGFVASLLSIDICLAVVVAPLSINRQTDTDGYLPSTTEHHIIEDGDDHQRKRRSKEKHHRSIQHIWHDRRMETKGCIIHQPYQSMKERKTVFPFVSRVNERDHSNASILDVNHMLTSYITIPSFIRLNLHFFFFVHRVVIQKQ